MSARATGASHSSNSSNSSNSSSSNSSMYRSEPPRPAAQLSSKRSKRENGWQAMDTSGMLFDYQAAQSTAPELAASSAALPTPSRPDRGALSAWDSFQASIQDLEQESAPQLPVSQAGNAQPTTNSLRQQIAAASGQQALHLQPQAGDEDILVQELLRHESWTHVHIEITDELSQNFLLELETALHTRR